MLCRLVFLLIGVAVGALPTMRTFGQGEAPKAAEIEARFEKSGKQLFEETCAACHGFDGKGAPEVVLAMPRPDFSDCSFASREPDADWIAVAHQGGPVRGFSEVMPAHGDVLSVEDLQKIMDHVRGLCGNDAWPRGELNLPRPLVTEKAYPEDEAVLSSSVSEGAVMNEVVYEKRFGARNQIEIKVPFGVRELADGGWSGGRLGDVAIGLKRALYHSLARGSIVSVTGEVILPTGDADTGFGKGVTVVEPFVSVGQILPASFFVHGQGGAEVPLRSSAAEELFWRGVLGRSFVSGRWGRTWSPMVEVLGSRELEEGAAVHWDVVPQMQVTLNTRQHVMANIGVRIPVDDADRGAQVIIYVLWDWFDGGILEGW